MTVHILYPVTLLTIIKRIQSLPGIYIHHWGLVNQQADAWCQTITQSDQVFTQSCSSRVGAVCKWRKWWIPLGFGNGFPAVRAYVHVDAHSQLLIKLSDYVPESANTETFRSLYWKSEWVLMEGRSQQSFLLKSVTLKWLQRGTSSAEDRAKLSGSFLGQRARIFNSLNILLLKCHACIWVLWY